MNCVESHVRGGKLFDLSPAIKTPLYLTENISLKIKTSILPK